MNVFSDSVLPGFFPKPVDREPMRVPGCPGTARALLFSGLLMLGAGNAAATVILDVAGPQNTGATIGADQAVAVSFTLPTDRRNVSVDAPITCIACSGGIWLQENAIGSTASLADSLAAFAFDSTTARPFISGLDLTSGLYFFIVSINSGAAVWLGSDPVASVEAGAARGLDFRAADQQPFVPQSTFNVLFNGGLHFTVRADSPNSVPEPAMPWLFGTGALALGSLRYRRR